VQSVEIKLVKRLSELLGMALTLMFSSPVFGKITELRNFDVRVNWTRFGGGPVFSEIYR